MFAKEKKKKKFYKRQKIFYLRLWAIDGSIKIFLKVTITKKYDKKVV